MEPLVDLTMLNGSCLRRVLPALDAILLFLRQISAELPAPPETGNSPFLGRPGPVLVCDTPSPPPPPPPPRVLKDSGAGAMAPMAPNFLSHAELKGVLCLWSFRPLRLSSDKKSLLSHTYLYTPMSPDTHTPLRYACGSSGLRAAPAPPPAQPSCQYPPPTLPLTSPPPRQVLTDRWGGGGVASGPFVVAPRGQPPQSSNRTSHPGLR